ncbi:hypothetical protein [Kutzneria kofuensis]|uniref:Beta-ketoacyl synthase N-terminal domain-containing protein n=1 Tax=Kutzneria kofuensis TaxID=103725 RepID=A0A7W9KCQ1_9PSEU|nr:hypothetical protein [Kutzneria kofuensis]MBB5890126.1 hypothetical protein [Kutzneria kofuensis]
MITVAHAEVAGDLDPVPGFIESAFNPLVYHAAAQCLHGREFDGSRLAVVVASLVGDSTTTSLASRLLVDGQVHNAILFMQATANAVLGFLSREFDLTGPLLSVSTVDDDPLETADLLLADPELDAVLLLTVELAADERTAAAYRLLGRTPPTTDGASALLLERDPQ